MARLLQAGLRCAGEGRAQVHRAEHDPRQSFGQLATFLLLPAMPADIDRAIANTLFETLSAAEGKAGFSERPAGMYRFFRNGKSGVWRDQLSKGRSSACWLPMGSKWSVWGIRIEPRLLYSQSMGDRLVADGIVIGILCSISPKVVLAQN
jgi:hypothetical protein